MGRQNEKPTGMLEDDPHPLRKLPSKPMTIVLTNDDGINAPGIQALRSAIAQSDISEAAIAVAPCEQMSGCGHRVTTRRPIRVEKRASSGAAAPDYAVDGTPADCARLAISQLCPNPTWVLSGINAGGNLGVDEYISGTVAAVREASLHGVKAIALSHFCDRKRSIDWERAARWTQRVLADLMARPLEPLCFWNVNFPHPADGAPEPKAIFCKASRSPLPTRYRLEGDSYAYIGDYQQRDRIPDTDVDVCFSGNIAIVKLSTDARPPG